MYSDVSGFRTHPRSPLTVEYRWSGGRRRKILSTYSFGSTLAAKPRSISMRCSLFYQNILKSAAGTRFIDQNTSWSLRVTLLGICLCSLHQYSDMLIPTDKLPLHR